LLVTRRKEGQSIQVGDDIEITILNIGHGKVSIGITAPGNVRIQRTETHLVAEENVRAGRLPAGLFEKIKNSSSSAQIISPLSDKTVRTGNSGAGLGEQQEPLVKESGG